MRDNHLVLTVATLTRRRPKLLANLLESWSELDAPDNCTVNFLVVENDQAPVSEPVVVQAQNTGLAVGYALETEPGIPFGRNRAAKVAIETGSDILIFLDDDEIAAKDWLVRLIDGYRRSDAVLMGAPLRSRPPENALNWWQKLMYDNIERRYQRKETRAAIKADINQTKGVTIVTNNWLAEVGLFTEHGIWFDEKMRFTGGTDTKFYQQTREKSLPTGWVQDAFVYETITNERLSFLYQLARGRDQSNTNLRRKMEHNPNVGLKTIAPIVLKTLIAILLAISVPLTLGRTLLSFARTLGWVVGRVTALAGYRSKLYMNTTGE